MPTRHETIGCDVGGSSISVLRLHGARPSHVTHLLTPTTGRRAFLDTLCSALREAVETGDLTRAASDQARPRAVGVAFCGLLDPKRRRVVRSTHLPFLDGCWLLRTVEKRLNLPIILDADTNAGALAEAVLGAGRAHDRVLYLSLGTGVGAALVERRQPVRVSYHTVGQVSHLRLKNAGDEKFVEDLLSRRGILERALTQGLHIDSTAALFQKAEGGNRIARRVWRQVGEIIGELLVTLNSLWSPDAVIVGGGTSGAGAFFLDSARRYLRGHLPAGAEMPALATASKGRLGGAIGAALLAREAVR